MTEHEHFPRFMTDEQLRRYFGLSERALHRLKLSPTFPQRDELINKTDSDAVTRFFDHRSNLHNPEPWFAIKDGKEDFDERPKRKGGPRQSPRT